MITKKLFLSCIDTIKRYQNKEDKLYDGTDGMVNLLEIDEIQSLIHKLISLLGYCTKSDYSDVYGNDIDYFIYETEWGKKADEYFTTLESGEQVHFNTAEDVWNYLVTLNPDIEDVNENVYD